MEDMGQLRSHKAKASLSRVELASSALHQHAVPGQSGAGMSKTSTGARCYLGGPGSPLGGTADLEAGRAPHVL